MNIEALTAADIERMVSLLGEMQVSIAGIRSVGLYGRICADAVMQRNVVAVVAWEDGDIAGYVIALIDQRAYWRSIALRAPLLAARIALGRILAHLRTTGKRQGVVAFPPNLSSFVDSESGPETWADSSPYIAKVVMVGVRPDYRRRGVGAMLYRRLFEDLRARAVNRVDACVDAQNEASLWLHASTGWKLRNSGAGQNTVFCIHWLHPQVSEPYR